MSDKLKMGETHTEFVCDEYKCAKCGETYEKGWTDEEAAQEYKDKFPAEEAAQLPAAIICDDCYTTFMEWWTTEIACPRSSGA